MLNITAMMNAMAMQALEAGLGKVILCPLDDGIYARLDQVDPDTFRVSWIKAGHQSSRDDVERVLRERTGFLAEVANPYKR